MQKNSVVLALFCVMIQKSAASLEHLRLFLAVGDVAAAAQNELFAITVHLRGNAARKFQGAIFIQIAMNGQHRASNPAKVRVKAPARKIRGVPGFCPGSKDPACLIPVQAFQLGKWLRLGKVLHGGADARNGAFFHKGLGRFGNHRRAVLWVQGGNHQGHAAAHAVAKQGEIGETKRLMQGRKIERSFFVNELQRWYVPARGRFTKTKPVIGNHIAVAGKGQLARKIPPEINAAQGIVQQDKRRMPGCMHAPAAGKDLTAGNFHKEVAGCWLHCLQPVVYDLS